MLPESYSKWLQFARKQYQSNEKFLKKLKSKKPKHLDRIIQQLHEEAFAEIDCLQCANCCKTTGPLLLGKDIDRLSKHYKIRPAEFTENYVVTDEDGDMIFNKLPCPFLNADNCCRVYNDRPNACRQYPHTQQNNQLQKLNITLKNSVICPAVSKIIHELSKMQLV